MSHIDPVALTQLVVSLAALFGALATWISSHSNGKHVKENTEVTKQSAAVIVAKVDETSGKVDDNTAITKQLVLNTGSFPAYVPQKNPPS